MPFHVLWREEIGCKQGYFGLLSFGGSGVESAIVFLTDILGSEPMQDSLHFTVLIVALKHFIQLRVGAVSINLLRSFGRRMFEAIIAIAFRSCVFHSEVSNKYGVSCDRPVVNERLEIEWQSQTRECTLD